MTKEELERLELLEAQVNSLQDHNAQLQASVKRLTDQNRKFQRMVKEDLVTTLANVRIIADVLWPPDPGKSADENRSRPCSPGNSMLRHITKLIEILIAHALQCDPPLVQGAENVRELTGMIKRNQKLRNE